MDLLYTMHRKPLKCTPPNLESLNGGPTLCTISTGNIAAFTSLTELEDDTGGTWGCHVYVCDIDTPWNCYKVASFVRQVSALEWDQQGRHLLVADCAGDVCFFTSKDYLLNEWTCPYKASFPGEHIIKAAFFHNGRKIVLSSDKKPDQTLCTDKFQYLRFAPSVKQFGGVAAEGAVVITATGMLGAILLPLDAPNSPTKNLPVACESLGSTRGYITTADICYGKKGHFLVAVSSGNVYHAIQCYKVSVKRSSSLQDEQKPLTVTSQALPSFFLRDCTIKDYHCSQIVQVRWASREDTDSLIVAGNGPHGRAGLVELWGLVERSLPVHSILAKGPTSTHNNSECFNTVLWQHQCSYHSSSAQVVSVTSSKVQIAGSVTGGSLMTPSLPYIFITLNDNTVHCLYRDTLKQASSASLSQAWSLAEGIVMGGGTPPKQMKFSPMHGGQGSPGPCNSMCSSICLQQPGATISSCDASWLGGVLLVIDSTSHLYMYKLPQPALENGTSIAIHHITTLLEYSMVTGFDCLDITMVLKPVTIEPIYERFTENFLRQPAIWQQFYYTKWLTLRASLSRMISSGQTRASDLTSLLMLHSIATAFKSLLRPSDLTSHDKGPAESLSAMISDQTNPVADIDKALMHLEPKEFTVEPSTLQSAQQLIQWAAEVALSAMARLPTASATNSNHGYELFRDANALNTLRELLVVVRVWGLLRSHCLPVFTKSAENVDVLSLLYKLLTRLAHNGCEPDEALLEECSMLPSQVLIPQINESLPRTCIVSPALYHQNLPLQLEFGVEPDMLKYIPDIVPLEGSITSETCMDSIRHLHLGLRPSSIKRCGRCGAAAAKQALQRTAAIRAWDQRWLPACRCGGLWTIENNT